MPQLFFFLIFTFQFSGCGNSTSSSRASLDDAEKKVIFTPFNFASREFLKNLKPNSKCNNNFCQYSFSVPFVMEEKLKAIFALAKQSSGMRVFDFAEVPSANYQYRQFIRGEFSDSRGCDRIKVGVIFYYQTKYSEWLKKIPGIYFPQFFNPIDPEESSNFSNKLPWLKMEMEVCPENESPKFSGTLHTNKLT